MRLSLVLAACTILAACDFRIDLAESPGNPAAPSTTNITNTNTNTNTASTDRSDTGASTPGPGSGSSGEPGAALPLPAYGEAEAFTYAATQAHLLAASCQVTHGEAAWQFLDGLIARLQARDARWGYLCKDAGCTKVAADIVAYKAGAGDLGFWIVDVIGNHCPNPGDVVEVRWGVLPFETVRRWIGRRP